MIPHEALINALRRLGYGFKTQSQRVVIYKRPNHSARVVIHKRDLHDETYARGVLRSAGMGGDDIQRFIVEVKADKR